jgi:DNA-directed RNA polymerase subunit E'
MYKVIRAKGIVRIPPEYFDKPLNEVALEMLRKDYQERLIKDLGLVLAVVDVKINEEGILIFGDGATYHEVEFAMLVYVPLQHELVEGEIVNVDNVGIYVNLGPIDGFVHVSQITDEPLKYDPTRAALIGERSKKVYQKGDKVRARITAISPGGVNRLPRVALTMRQPYLGKIETTVVKKG